MAKLGKREARKSRHTRIRSRLSGTASRPRLCVFRSLKHIYAQVVDDAASATVASASSLTADKPGGDGRSSKKDAAAVVGTRVAEEAKAKGISEVVFDRGGYRYHGRVKVLAEAARKAGLKF